MSDMYSYNNNSERNEKYGAEDFYDYETPNENGQKRNNRKPNAKMVKFAKRVGAIALSAVLFGGVAAGTFQGVGSLIGTSAKSDGYCKIRNAFHRLHHKQIGSGSRKLLRYVRRPEFHPAAGSRKCRFRYHHWKERQRIADCHKQSCY